jgi:hypothetical protein
MEAIARKRFRINDISAKQSDEVELPSPIFVDEVW